MYAEAPVAIVDIGSNSVRLVVYSGATRLPSVIFNEKVMAGLGRGMDATGALSEESQKRALTAMARFRLLVTRMGVVRTRVVATAAVRDAVNAGPFLDAVRQIGFEPLVLSGEEEARLAALGVISGMPDADGVIGDLGGGSLELADVQNGAVRSRVSLPVGVLRLPSLGKPDNSLLRRIRRQLEETDFARTARGRTFYLVGGSWRALARLDLALTNHPLPVTHQHLMPPARPEQLHDQIVAITRARKRWPFHPSACGKGCSTTTSTRRSARSTR
jgi:exopolyphosphatase/guanosine-5'-triphosphate,3'-diphosphate pyrophosphatase